MRTKRVAVLGGGILGCGIFALLANHEELDVKLFEAGRVVAASAAAKNHGRNHCGATGVFSDPEIVTERKLLGNRYLRMLPGFSHNKGPGIYRCKIGINPDRFRLHSLARGIEISELHELYAGSTWFKRSISGEAFSVPEFSLSPVEVANVLHHVGTRTASYAPNFRATKIRRRSGKLWISFEKEKDAQWADFIINATSRYANTIDFGGRDKLFKLAFYRWPVMAVRSNDVEVSLHHVLSFVDTDGTNNSINEGLFPSAIPHRDWITFDCKTKPELVESPNAYPQPNPRRYDPNNAQEKLIFDKTREVFEPLGSLPESEFAKCVRVFYGIHGRREGPAAESDLSKSFAYSDVENYIIRHGGLATTALLDAIETVEDLEMRLWGSIKKNRYDRLEDIVNRINLTRGRPEPFWAANIPENPELPH